VALIRRSELTTLCKHLGADEVYTFKEGSYYNDENLKAMSFDLVFDTSGSPQAFPHAVELATRAVHLKSTHGQGVLGQAHLSDMVVDEISLLPLNDRSLNFHWPREQQKEIRQMYASPEISDEILAKLNLKDIVIHRTKTAAALETMKSFQPFPAFDLALATTARQLDEILRPVADRSLLRPRGAVLVNDGFALGKMLNDRQIELHTSRCGSFHRALEVLQKDEQLLHTLTHEFITAVEPLARIDQAFAEASGSEHIKVVVQTSTGIP
jgi:threonine dehydrogenase-like Zn-dependent dehydrogenase